MRKAPADRYETAQALADDLRRFLEDRPIEAKRPTLLKRVGKWCARHRPLVAAAAIIGVLALIGTSIATVLVRDAYESEAKQRARAEGHFDTARKAVEQGARHREALAELALARVLRAEGRIEAAREALARVTLGIAETGGRATEPAVVEEGARLDQLEGNDPAPALARARELYSSIGAKGHAERIARELAELS